LNLPSNPNARARAPQENPYADSANNQSGRPPANQSSIQRSPLDGPAVLVVTGSLWTQSINTLLTMTVQLDGTSVGTAKIWSNGVSTHRTFPSFFLTVNLTYGQHVLTLTPGASVLSDLNDTFTASLIF
jgi:hypothetical protein